MKHSLRKCAAALLLSSFYLAVSSFQVQTAPIIMAQKSATPAGLSTGNEVEIERLIAKNACPGCNLAGANLVGLNLNRANLAGANLSGANLQGVSLKTADLAEANLSQANLTGANLAGADLYKADLSGAILSETDLQGAYLLGTILEKPNQKGSKEDIAAFLAQYRKKETPTSKGKKPRKNERAGMDMWAPSFKVMQTTTPTNVPEQKIEAVNLTVASSSSPVPARKETPAALPSSHVAAPTQPAITLPPAKTATVETQPPATTGISVPVVSTPPPTPTPNTQHSAPSIASTPSPSPAQDKTLEKVKAPELPKLTDLEKLLQFNRCGECNLAGLDLSGKKLKEAFLERSNLSGTNLRGANLEGANLKGANLSGANLENTNLEGADLYKANLSNTNLKGANLKDAAGLKL